ncbi:MULTISPECIES: copper resistance CopC family protein [Auritidibacter]|uniref:Copper resistance protein CopC n=1 Tax=Auritidibacter ignavus TaxID=678932 RepID=A0AAJ6DBT0_9MICC|nr:MULTISPECIES: copper resistance CopC family protein [Auritidibacter]PXA80785.1 hypothetical protein DCC26_03455 [Auritidibacter sp. NML120779]AXR74829.1 copper resistance protein CopC [Auritidibacter sp. NML130574]NIH71242.1 hypothetical protein [Auritidibacter ignavus]PXA78321.1 hypothetical protein DCC24_01160 [Auritidibacter sp. NML100628]PXA81087.1 hypothetical protein DCC25_04410 [Auritidibacter sp. NML120636]
MNTALALARHSVRMTTMITGLFMAVILSFGMALSLSAPAQAHDVLTETTPADGEETSTTPDEVRLTFSGQPTEGANLANLITVSDADGQEWQTGEVSVEGYDIAVDVCPGLPAGDYEISYRVIYSDGHTGEDTMSFTNADPNAPESGDPAKDCDGAAEEPTEEASSEVSEEGTQTAEANTATQTGENTEEASIFTSWVFWAIVAAVVLVVVIVVALIMRAGRGNSPEADTKR